MHHRDVWRVQVQLVSAPAVLRWPMHLRHCYLPVMTHFIRHVRVQDRQDADMPHPVRVRPLLTYCWLFMLLLLLLLLLLARLLSHAQQALTITCAAAHHSCPHQWGEQRAR